MSRLASKLAAMALAMSIIAAPVCAIAVQPDEVLADPAQEARARALSAQLRCMVCQNQSIDDSDAELARDLRLLVRERIVAGDSDEQVIAYLVDRYGEFVLLKPLFTGRNLMLWATPFAVLLIGGVTFFAYTRRRPLPGATATPTALSADEEARLARLLDDRE
jgi:cytochrome c-type biogenesis protein CcmH